MGSFDTKLNFGRKWGLSLTQNASKHKIRQILSLKPNKIWGKLYLDEMQLNGQIITKPDCKASWCKPMDNGMAKGFFSTPEMYAT